MDLKKLSFLLAIVSIMYLTGCAKNDEKPAPINCDGLITDTLGTNDEGRIYISNAFTGNNDGLNDIFIPFVSHISSIQFTIYDENNAVVFTTNQIGIGWKPALTNQQYTHYYYSIQATTTANRKIGKCGEVYNINCLPKNLSLQQLYFQDQLTPFGYTGVTQEVLANCP